MTGALKELRADLVQQAEEAVKLNASNAAQDWNIQKLIDKRTKDLKERIAELEADLEKVRGAEIQCHTECCVCTVWSIIPTVMLARCLVGGLVTTTSTDISELGRPS